MRYDGYAAPFGEIMNHYRKSSLLIRVRNGLCYALLILAVFCEAFTVLAIDLDQFFPSWYRTLGWVLLALPAVLATGLLFLHADRRRLGFWFCATSLSLYAVTVLMDANRDTFERRDWIFEISWVTFCGIGILAAKSLMNRPQANATVRSLSGDS